MFYSTLLLATAAFTGIISAQNSSAPATPATSAAPGGYYSTSGPLEIDPAQVPDDTRLAWCRAQEANCPYICGGPGQAFPNNCETATLEYQCVCNDNSKPNISDYANTIPSFVCAQWKQNCVAAHPNDLSGQTGCLSVECGQKNATAGFDVDGASPSASATSGGSGGSGGSQASASASSSGSGAQSTGNAAVHLTQSMGTSVFAVVMLALFGLAL